MKNKKKISGYDVGIICSIIGTIASLLVIVINAINKESITVGIGLLLFCFISLIINKNGKRKEKWYKLQFMEVIMNKGDLLRCLGILTYVVLTIIDRFCFNIADYIYIPIALIGIALIIIGFILNKKSK